MTRNKKNIEAVFAEIDRLGGADFLLERRPEQPSMPPPRRSTLRDAHHQRGARYQPRGLRRDE